MKYEKEIGEWILNFAMKVIKLCSELRKSRVDLDVIVQLRKSGTSVEANVNEGKSSSSKIEEIRKVLSTIIIKLKGRGLVTSDL